jgi:hypothetical protein
MGPAAHPKTMKPGVFNAKAQREMKAAKLVGKQLQEFLCALALSFASLR